MASGSTRTLLFGIFVLAGRRLTAAQVIRAARPLRISPSNVKSHLTRLVAEGAMERHGPVRLAEYGIARNQVGVVEGIAARLRENTEEPWDGGWLMLSPQTPAN